MGRSHIGWGLFFIDDVSIEKAPPFAEVPNVFTPNGDNVNEQFTPTVYNTKEWEMIIMNRWGNMVVKLDQNNPIWNGKDCSDGIYFYEISTLKENIGQGFISIIRN